MCETVIQVFFGGRRQFDLPPNVCINSYQFWLGRMIVIDSNEMSLEWNESQIIYANQFVQDKNTGTICFESSPSFTVTGFEDSWNLSVNAAGLLECEITTRVDRLLNEENVLVVQGESQPRMINERLTYVYKKFQKAFALPPNVMIDTKSHGFSNGILIISFQKQIE